MSQIGNFGSGGGGAGTVVSLTGNAGGAVGPNIVGNINVVGAGNMTITGVPGTNTLTTTISATPTFTTVYATTFDTNVAAAGVTLAGTTLSADGTDPNININITTKGTGALVYDGISTGFNSSQWVTAQYGLQTLDATVTPIVAFAVAAGQMVTCKAYINGFKSTFDQACGAEVLFTVYRPVAGNVTIVGDGVVNLTSTAAVDVTTTVDVASQEIRINVIGIAAQTWNWVASYNYFFTVTNA